MNAWLNDEGKPQLFTNNIRNDAGSSGQPSSNDPKMPQ